MKSPIDCRGGLEALALMLKALLLEAYYKRKRLVFVIINSVSVKAQAQAYKRLNKRVRFFRKNEPLNNSSETLTSLTVCGKRLFRRLCACLDAY